MSDHTPTRAEKDLALWKTWKADPSEQNLTVLMEHMQPLVLQTVNRWKAAPVPTSAIHAMANVHLKTAIDKYDPTKVGESGQSAQLASYATWHLKKTGTFVHRYQNVGRMPDHRIERITDYKTARDELAEKLGHPPDPRMLVDHLGAKWSIKEVERMEKELQSDYVASQNVVTDLLVQPVSAKERDIARYIVDDLVDPEERLVYEYSMGLNGKPRLSAAQIAETMGKSGPWVSRARGKIDKKLRARGV